jgi:hypothetical protein
MVYHTGNCPRCGIKINFQESSIGTLRRCQSCGQEFVLTAAPSSGCATAVMGLVIGGAIAVTACGGLLFLIGATMVVPAKQEQIAVMPADAPTEPESKPAIADTKPVAEVRMWSDKSGEFSAEATFGGVVAGTTVTLHKSDGTTVKVQLDQLSDSDREWIEQRRKAH